MTLLSITDSITLDGQRKREAGKLHKGIKKQGKFATSIGYDALMPSVARTGDSLGQGQPQPGHSFFSRFRPFLLVGLWREFVSTSIRFTYTRASSFIRYQLSYGSYSGLLLAGIGENLRHQCVERHHSLDFDQEIHA